jgi:hypothetical protein
LRSVAGHTTAVRLAPRSYRSLGGGWAVVMPQVTPTIPIASLSGGDPELSISNKDWKRIELAYGHDVPATAREQIYNATLMFLFFVEGEQAARPVSEARKRIERLKKAASVFQKEFHDKPQNIGSDSRIYADYLVDRYLNDLPIGAPERLRSMELMASSLIAACNRALADLGNRNNQGRRRGETWGNWVCHVTKIMDAHQLPTEVRKDTDKNKKGKPSPFVTLIRELQARIPDANRRSSHSDMALSEAIARARRSRSGRKSPRGDQE